VLTLIFQQLWAHDTLIADDGYDLHVNDSGLAAMIEKAHDVSACLVWASSFAGDVLGP
jgi:hypothetical protein